jgi:hypothetical protein
MYWNWASAPNIGNLTVGKIRDVIVDDVRAAQARNDKEQF